MTTLLIAFCLALFVIVVVEFCRIMDGKFSHKSMYEEGKAE